MGIRKAATLSGWLAKGPSVGALGTFFFVRESSRHLAIGCNPKGRDIALVCSVGSEGKFRGKVPQELPLELLLGA